MLNFLEGAAWFCTIALVLRLMDYQVPFAHHLERFTEPPQVEQEATPQRLPPEPPTALQQPPQQFQGFQEQWNARNPNNHRR